MNGKVYLVTADVFQLLRQWAKESGFIMPPKAFFREAHTQVLATLENTLGQTTRVVSLQAELLADGVTGIVREMENVPVVAMDPLLFNIPTGNRPRLTFQSTRLSVYEDKQWHKLDEGPRPYFPPLKEQAASIAQSVKTLYDTDRVIVVDDGCYDGDSLKNCVRLLTEANLQVVGAAVGIHRKKAESLSFNFPFQAFLTYPETDIVDWICERDFFPGVPYGGRTIHTNGEIAAPLELAAYYLHTFGYVEKWATIPVDKVVVFSNEILQIVRRIFQEVQKATDNRPVLASDIKRWPMFLRRDEGRPFLEYLHQPD